MPSDGKASAEADGDTENSDDETISKEDVAQFWDRYYSDTVAELREFGLSAVEVDHSDIVTWSPDLADDLITHPSETMDLLRRGLVYAADYPDSKPEIRISGKPNRVSIRDLRDEHMGELVTLRGVISQASEVKVQMDKAVFECKMCSTFSEIHQYKADELAEPKECDSCGWKTPHAIVEEMCETSDVQHLRIQESPDELRAGETPEYIDTEVYGDLCHRVSPGDRITVIGTVRLEKGLDSRQASLRLDTNNIEPRETDIDSVELDTEDKERIRKESDRDDIEDALVESFAPSIYGYETEKRALLYQMFGAPLKKLADGTEKRGDIHILLCGDPGTAKSQLIEYAHEVAPRSVHTSAKNATGVGLTASAEQDDFGDSTEWTIKPGALPMADKGLIGVDELDKTGREERGALHEALEQQKVSYSKAGKTGQFRARCSLLAAANPSEGRFDEHMGIVEQVDLEPALMSRFDLIFPVYDKPDEEFDSELGDHILDSVREAQGDKEDVVAPEYPPEFLRKYISYARRNVEPALTDEAHDKLREWWVSLRQEGDNPDAVPATPRQLEAAERLAEASARVRLKDEITENDAERAIGILMSSLLRVGRDPETGEFDIDVIESGTTQTQRERVRSIEQVVEQLTEEGSAPIDEVVDVCISEEIATEDEVYEWIDSQKRQGEAMEPTKGEVRLV